MIVTKIGQVVRVKTMADGSKRAEIDFGERVTLGEFDDLMQMPVVVTIIPEITHFNMMKDEEE